jgi:hypothetical protein
MDYKSLSLNTKYITKLSLSGSIGANKPSLKQKTDRGNQLIALSNYKRNFLNGNIENNRLDLVLFNLKFTTSIAQSQHFIKQRLIKVNGVIVKNTNFKLKDFSIISCLNTSIKDSNNLFKNKLTHDISNLLDNNFNFLRINANTAIFYYNPSLIMMPKTINLALMRRSQN